MRSSGLIYAVIVGAWAAYLVPMWLRRQDELNEARPTERFSTAIRLLSGRAAMQRRYDKERGARPADDAGDEQEPDALDDPAGDRSFGDPHRPRRSPTTPPPGRTTPRRAPRSPSAPSAPRSWPVAGAPSPCCSSPSPPAPSPRPWAACPSSGPPPFPPCS
ncbi:hypothetical protein O1L44_20030 [Streptomyces noursei]|nr:hypothetical protein [Streptomyces noursei]